MRLPFFVIGYEVTEDNMQHVADWCHGHLIRTEKEKFILVPVENAKSFRQVKAYPGMWILMGRHKGEFTYKVYETEWLNNSFARLPHGALWMHDSDVPLMNSNPGEDLPPPTIIHAPLPSQVFAKRAG